LLKLQKKRKERKEKESLPPTLPMGEHSKKIANYKLGLKEPLSEYGQDYKMILNDQRSELWGKEFLLFKSTMIVWYFVN
jgi:hypothetical protein